jgi:hypothetical protein
MTRISPSPRKRPRFPRALKRIKRRTKLFVFLSFFTFFFVSYRSLFFRLPPLLLLPQSPPAKRLPLLSLLLLLTPPPSPLR